jgi:hypothetical protein
MFGRMRRTRELKRQLHAEMKQRFGVTQQEDYGSTEGTMLQTAAARCIHCTEAARCKDWLANTTGTEDAADFCPNAGMFATLGRRARR